MRTLLSTLSCFGLLLLATYSTASGEPAKACQQPDYAPLNTMVYVKGGVFTMGDNQSYSEEAGAHQVNVQDFWMSRYEVSNQDFKAFTDATGYITVAERYLDAESYPDLPDSQREPGSVVFLKPKLQQGRMGNWWHFVNGANWRHPEGPNSNLDGRMNQPVVHIAYEDALAYARWKGHQLPSEAQWEYAARVATSKKNTAQPSQANTWQGLFPMHNLKDDGFESRAPVGCYRANEQGLHDMIGNVWEWTSSKYFPRHNFNARDQYPEGLDPKQRGVAVQTVKGGSFLCAPNFCRRYRPTARHAQDSTLGTSHIGFRTVLNKPDLPDNAAKPSR